MSWCPTSALGHAGAVGTGSPASTAAALTPPLDAAGLPALVGIAAHLTYLVQEHPQAAPRAGTVSGTGEGDRGLAVDAGLFYEHVFDHSGNIHRLRARLSWSAMTLAICVVTSDGVAIAADSRTTIAIPGTPVRVLSDYTHKVFQVGQVGVATYGWAFLLGRNIAGHMADFVRDLPADQQLGPREAAERVAEFFAQRLEQHFSEDLDPRPGLGEYALGFLVGGYGANGPSSYEVTVPGPTVTQLPAEGGGPGAVWRGQTDVVSRVVKGIDAVLLASLAVAEDKARPLAELTPVLAQMEYVIPFDNLNLQDAIDLATFLIRTTIDAQRLTNGTVGSIGSWPGVGGPIEIAVITADGFAWVQRTELQGERPAGVAERI